MRDVPNERLAEPENEPCTPPHQKLDVPASPPGAPKRQPCLAAWISRPREDSLDLREYFLGLPVGEAPVSRPLQRTLSRHYHDREQESTLRCKIEQDPIQACRGSRLSPQKVTTLEDIKRLADVYTTSSSHGASSFDSSSPVTHVHPLGTYKRQKLDLPADFHQLHAKLDDNLYQHVTELDPSTLPTYPPQTPSPPLTSASIVFHDLSSSPADFPDMHQ